MCVGTATVRLAGRPLLAISLWLVPIITMIGLAVGIDYSLFIGVPVAGLLYLWFARGIDLTKEKELAAAEGNLSSQH